jgi:dTDP-4-dehydrorhamnose 3,5-epimerase
MIFTETELNGAYIIEIEKLTDNRGFFGRAWCQKEFEQHNLIARIRQVNVSSNMRKGTLRGMHYQIAPYQETKLVRCTRGSIYDVIIDLRTSSPTYGRWTGVELTAKNYRLLYVPEDFAHGFQTLEDNTEVTYQVSQFYMPGSEGGIRWNDPAFSIEWPMSVQVLSEKDDNWPNYSL